MGETSNVSGKQSSNQDLKSTCYYDVPSVELFNTGPCYKIYLCTAEIKRGQGVRQGAHRGDDNRKSGRFCWKAGFISLCATTPPLLPNVGAKILKITNARKILGTSLPFLMQKWGYERRLEMQMVKTGTILIAQGWPIALKRPIGNESLTSNSENATIPLVHR